jgi:osmotically-inducible protein OsmY
VNKGVVLLSGKTKSLEAHLEAVEVANAVRGVRRVATEVEVMPPS